jgi:hypothetical protein
MSFRWTRRPTELPIAARIARLEAGVERVARTSALAMEAAARTNAPWQDDSGAARNGLRGFPARDGDRIRIILCHSVDYGPFLELARGGKYAILWPTIEQELPQLKAGLAGLLR